MKKRKKWSLVAVKRTVQSVIAVAAMQCGFAYVYAIAWLIAGGQINSWAVIGWNALAGLTNLAFISWCRGGAYV